MEKTTEQNFDEMFPVIDPSELIGCIILAYHPKPGRQERLMKDIWRGIEMKLPAFRAPCMDPSEEDGRIVFKHGNKPAVGHSASWWEETWKQFKPEKNSRSGTELHWAALLGKQMKYLVEEKNYYVEDAWKAMCNDSRDMGHYWNSENAKYELEPTGSRKVGAFFDLANTCKIIKKMDDSGFLIASGNFNFKSYIYPLATLSEPSKLYADSVGWFVMDV